MFSAVAPSCGDTDEPHLSRQATGRNQNVTTSYPAVLLLLLEFSFNVIPYFTSYFWLDMTYVDDCVWNDKRPNQGLVIWAYLESYYWATMVQVNLRYTGTSIYSHIFIFCPFWRFIWWPTMKCWGFASGPEWLFLVEWASVLKPQEKWTMSLGLVSQPESPPPRLGRGLKGWWGWREQGVELKQRPRPGLPKHTEEKPSTPASACGG